MSNHQYAARVPGKTQGYVGDVAVQIHVATGCWHTFIGQRLFDTLRWNNLATIIPLKKVSDKKSLEDLAQYLSYAKPMFSSAVRFMLTVSGKRTEVTAIVVPALRSPVLVLGGDFSAGKPFRLEITPNNSKITVDGIKIPFDSEPVTIFPGAPRAEYFDFGIDVFTDGACSQNGYLQARGALAVVFPGYPAYDITETLKGDVQTNNRAEYTAVRRALQQAQILDPNGHRKLRIFTDSLLLVDSLTNWISNWRRNGWRTVDGLPVQNRDLIESIDALSSRRKAGVQYIHIRAHTGAADWASRWNHEADRRAQQCNVPMLSPSIRLCRE